MKRLNNQQMAEFVRTGLLKFDGIIPPEVCAAALEEVRTKEKITLMNEGRQTVAEMAANPKSPDWPAAILKNESLLGALHSLVGEDFVVDEIRTHHRGVPGGADNREMSTIGFHYDAIMDARPHSFDVNLSFFPHEITPDMGGTAFVPGSQFRRVRSDFARCQQFRGAIQTVCPVGTVALWHSNLWHAAPAILSDKERTMLYLRLSPTLPQQQLWDMTDYDPEAVRQEFLKGAPWWGIDYPMEIAVRARHWRYLSGDHSFDINGYWSKAFAAFEDDLRDPIFRGVIETSPPYALG